MGTAGTSMKCRKQLTVWSSGWLVWTLNSHTDQRSLSTQRTKLSTFSPCRSSWPRQSRRHTKLWGRCWSTSKWLYSTRSTVRCLNYVSKRWSSVWSLAGTCSSCLRCRLLKTVQMSEQWLSCLVSGLMGRRESQSQRLKSVLEVIHWSSFHCTYKTHT